MKVFADKDGLSVLEFSKREGSVFDYQKAVENIKKNLDVVESDKPEAEVAGIKTH